MPAYFVNYCMALLGHYYKQPGLPTRRVWSRKNYSEWSLAELDEYCYNVSNLTCEQYLAEFSDCKRQLTQHVCLGDLQLLFILFKVPSAYARIFGASRHGLLASNLNVSRYNFVDEVSVQRFKLGWRFRRLLDSHVEYRYIYMSKSH